jgi:hypothetical protein
MGRAYTGLEAARRLEQAAGLAIMEMHQIRYFLAAARTLNFTHAAEECHVAQPSLSQAIKKLEEELGGLLFRRERSLTHLTDLGRMVSHCLPSATTAPWPPRSLPARSARAASRRCGSASPTPSTLKSCFRH